MYVTWQNLIRNIDRYNSIRSHACYALPWLASGDLRRVVVHALGLHVGSAVQKQINLDGLVQGRNGSSTDQRTLGSSVEMSGEGPVGSWKFRDHGTGRSHAGDRVRQRVCSIN